MHPNVTTLILAGATPVEINPSHNRSPRRIGAMSSDGRTVLGRRASKEVANAWLLGSWAVWDVAARHSYRGLTEWVHPDAQWNQIPPEVLAEFVEGA